MDHKKVAIMNIGIGNIGNFCRMSNKDRISILLTFLGSEVKVSISSLHISAA